MGSTDFDPMDLDDDTPQGFPGFWSVAHEERLVDWPVQAHDANGLNQHWQLTNQTFQMFELRRSSPEWIEVCYICDVLISKHVCSRGHLHWNPNFHRRHSPTEALLFRSDSLRFSQIFANFRMHTYMHTCTHTHINTHTHTYKFNA
jgi:hypothetical protein